MNLTHPSFNKTRLVLWHLAFLGVLIWSAIQPKDFYTWVLEASPAIVGWLILLFTARRFPLTPLVYNLILVHAIILMVGAKYTYAEVPAFDWLAEWMGGERNNYDKLGHFAQGFVPAMIARELVIRHKVFNSAAWRNFFIVSFCLGFSAFYELIEWWVALLSEQAAESFLGTQGYVWDTQSDMFLALIGASSALLILSHYHDKSMASLKDRLSSNS